MSEREPHQQARHAHIIETPTDYLVDCFDTTSDPELMRETRFTVPKSCENAVDWAHGIADRWVRFERCLPTIYSTTTLGESVACRHCRVVEVVPRGRR